MKKILVSLASLAFISIPITSAISCSSIGISFTGVGSNSVSPLIKEGRYAYRQNPVALYQYDNSGSGAGFGSQASNPVKSDFGMSSSLKLPGTQNEKYGSKQDQIDNWAKNQIRTITWAIDAIGVGVNLPSDLSIIDNKAPQVDATFLAKTYNGESVKWTDLLLNEKGSSSANVIPIYIKGGENTSGKSEAFIKGMKKAVEKNTNNKYGSEKVVLNDGFEDHGDLKNNNGHTDSFTDLLRDNNDTDGSVMYYSLGQIAKELADKTSANHSNIQLSAVKGFGSDQDVPTPEMVQEGKYKFTRPFNMMYSTTNKKSIAFAKWLLGDEFQEEVHKIFVSLPKNRQDVAKQRNNLDIPDFKENCSLKGLNDKPTLANAKNLKLGLEI